MSSTAHGPSASALAAHMLSFDVEEYFQVEAAARAVSRDRWDELPPRLPAAVDRVLELLASHRVVATFFVLGWVAEHQPPLVRRIADAGHEIASHGTDHRMIGRLTPEEFRRTLIDSRRLLEDITGRPVLGYRAPTFSLTRASAWAIDLLAEAGYAYDSSVFPVRHDRYGVPDAPRFAHRAVGPGGGSLLEIPPVTLRLAGMNWPVGGGGYLRLLPVRLVGAALNKAARGGHQGMIYLHPWEFDPGQPVLPMGRLGTWRHRVNLHRTADKLAWLLHRHRFTSVRDSGLLPAVPDLESFAY
jgi:polysaccharide deacetylase family protein (PEP-CTERM system associated)